MSSAFSLTVDRDGVARLVFDLPGEKVNKFTSAVMTELGQLLDQLKVRDDIRALVLSSGKPDIFIAGADIAEIAGITSADDAAAKGRIGQAVFNQLGHLPFPTVAFIDGACMGGGLELALACTYRIATDHEKTKLGFPEVNLGILPGWGGSQRAPDLLGLVAGLDLVLSGRPVTCGKAYRMKLIDGVTAREFAAENVTAFVDRILTDEGRKGVISRRKRRSFMSWLLEGNPAGRMIVARQARKNILKKTGGHYPAPLRALEVILETYGQPMANGLEVEAVALGELAATPITANLVQLYFGMEALKKQPGASTAEPPRSIRSTGVLGAGIMGGGIAWLFAYRDISVRMKDLNWQAIARGYETAHGYFERLHKRRRLRPHQVNLKMHRLSGTTDYSGFHGVDLVVEAVVENMALKQQVLSEVEAEVRPDTIIVSNTSSLSVTEMASVLKRPEQFCGMHFFNPVNRMPLVEVIPGERTSPQTIASVVKLVRDIGKTPIVVGDCAGFLVNRLLVPYMNEAAHMLEDGAGVEQVDEIMTRFGMPMGPFALADEVGIDVGYKVARNLETAYGDRMGVSAMLGEVCEKRELLGRKGGEGFYTYNGKGKSPNANLGSGLKSLRNGTTVIGETAIIDRALLIMVNEAARCLEEDVVATPAFLDMAMVMGTGFPAFRGGLLRYADERGLDDVVATLERLTETAGKRFRPCALLVEMARRGERFYDRVN